MHRRAVDVDRARVELAHTLRDLRVGRGWTQGELSARCDVDVRSLSAYELATRLPPLDVLVRIFDAYGLLLTEALDDTYPFGRLGPGRRRRPLTDGRRTDA